MEGPLKNPASGQTPTIADAQPSSPAGSSPTPRLEHEQLETLAGLIASRVQRDQEDRARETRMHLVTARQAAELLAVDLKTVYRHAKELGGRKVGRAWRFDLAAEAMDGPVASSARYASERPQPSERPAVQGQKDADNRPRHRVRCPLLSVGRASDSAGQ